MTGNLVAGIGRMKVISCVDFCYAGSLGGLGFVL
jgi:hypothetical protein